MSLILQEIVSKVNDLFIETRYTHLVQKRDGSYYRSNVKKNEENKIRYAQNGWKFRPDTYLADWKVELHLKGQQTVGVFGTSYGSKFLTFDVDFEDIELAKWTTLKVVYKLMELGVSEEDIHVNFSGSKGFHVDLYFNKNISSKTLNKFYQLVMRELDFEQEGSSDKPITFTTDGGAVEQRPDGLGMGVKLPLGVHKGTKRRCNYVDVFNRFEEYPMEHILSIEKMDAAVIYNILNEQEDLTLTEEQKAVAETEKYIERKYTPLEVYKQGIDEEATIEAYERLEKYGMTQKGTRHFSIFKLARYYRHLGLDREEAKSQLKVWMAEQDRRLYKTDYQLCLKDIDLTTDYIYDKEISIVTEKDYVNVSYEEMVEITKAKSKNQKLLLFSMLIHSKRYADKKGIFYMTYKQMNQTTTLTEKNARINVRKLEEQGLLDIVATNQKQEGTFMKKPNKYRLNINATGEEKVVSVKCHDGEIEDIFNDTLVKLIPLDYVKKNFPRRHYEQVRGLYAA